jgi:cytoskeletal protein RodZ
MVERAAFGARLRRERERRQITLASIAESTKISKSLLDSLERGDASQWPSGIYCRAFLREYATVIGLPAEAVITEFQRLFPEPGTSGSHEPRGTDDTGELRLTLVQERGWSPQSVAAPGW